MSKSNISQFRKEYIWGFTQGNPIKQSKDKESFVKLISLISKTGTISIGSSFHPYHLLNGKGSDLWDVFFNSIENSNTSDLQTLIDKSAIYHVSPPSQDNFPIIKWDDERLFIESNPEFGKFVPFVVPYITYNDEEDPLWLTKLQDGLKEQYTAKAFIEEVNKASRFFLSEPTFILGFDEFDKENPSQLVDHFVQFLNNVIKDVKQ